MRHALLLIAIAALPWAGGFSDAEREPPISAGEAAFALDILYRQKVRPRPIRPEKFHHAEKRAAGPASIVDSNASPSRPNVGPMTSRAGMPFAPS
jgi:hypothetical protein